MILLDTTTKSLEILLSAGVSTQLPIIANWTDIGTSGTDAVTGVADGTLTTNDTTAVTVVPAPGASTTRQVKFLSVRNVNSAAVTVILRVNNSGTFRTLVAVSLTQDETLIYSDGLGVMVLNWNGEQKESSVLVNLTSQVTGVLPPANGGTGDATLAAHGVMLGNGTSPVTVLAPDASLTKVLTSGGVGADPSWQPGGSVTSVAMTVPSILSVAGSPITGAGTLAVTLANENANTVLAGPVSGGATTPAFRNLDPLDMVPLYAVVTSQFDKTTDVTLANVPGLTLTLVAGKTYFLHADLICNLDTTGGMKVGLGGTATATTLAAYILTAGNGVALNMNQVTSITTLITQGAGGVAPWMAQIYVYIVVNAGGTLTIQFAQNASNGTSSVKVGSSFRGA